MGEGFFRHAHITSTGVNTISISSDGVLHGITLNQVSTGSTTATTGLITVYNGTTTAASSATNVIAILNPAATGIPEYIYNVLFPNGLTLQVGSVVAPLDITVRYR